MPAYKKSTKAKTKASGAKKRSKMKDPFLSMSYGKADAFCTRAGRELKKKRTSSAGRRLRSCR